MGVHRGSLTFSRFFVQGKAPRDLRKRYLESVRLRKFAPLAPEDEADEAVGWCVIGRPFDLEFEPDKLFFDRYVELGLRVDKWRIPSAVLRSNVADEEQRLLSRSGREKLSRAEQKELKLRVIARLRRKFMPSTRAVDVLWDLDRGTVLLFTHSARTIDEFAALFEKTFGLELVQDSPFVAATRAGLSARELRELDRVEPVSFSAARKRLNAKEAPPRDPERKQTAGENEDEEALLDRIESTRFLGSELLLWLWVRAEIASAAIGLGELGEAELWLEQKLVLEHVLDKAERVTVRGARPTDSSEAREAVRSSKMPVSSRLVLQTDEPTFAWDLNGPDFAIGAGKIPSPITADDDDQHLERLALIEKLSALNDAAYSVFLRERLAPLWQEAWEPAILAWAEGDAIPARILQALAAFEKSSRRARGRAFTGRSSKGSLEPIDTTL